MNNEVTRQVLGIVGLTYKGEYSSLMEYHRGNVISYQGSSYVALGDTTGNLPTNTTYFQLIAQRGEQGIQGEQGVQGPKPVKGVDYYTESDTQAIVDDVVSYFVNADEEEY